MTQASAQIQQDMAGVLKGALAAEDEKAASEMRNVMWESLRGAFKKVNELAGKWDTLSPRAGEVHAYH